MVRNKMSELNFNIMGISDIKAVSEIEKDCFSVPWSENSLEEELTNDFARFYVLNINGETIGYIGAHNVLGEVYITNVAVFKKWQGKGYGKALVNFLLEEMKKEKAQFATLEVRKSNETAIALYKKTGFSEVGCRKGFYESPKEDALLMTYYLKETE